MNHSYRISSIRCHGYYLFLLFVALWVLFEGGVYFFEKPTDSSNEWISQWLLDPVSSSHSLSVLLSAMATNTSHGYYSRGGVFHSELLIVQLLFEGGVYSKKYGTIYQ